MSNFTLKERISSYEDVSSYKLLPRLPIAIVINGRSFSNITSLLDKPFCQLFAKSMYAALIKLVQEIDGAVFGYSFNDEIVIIVRNDQHIETEPWYNNDVQKIASVASSITTLEFNNYINSIDLNLHGEGIFLSKVFAVPNITEAINLMVSKQQLCFKTSIQAACFYELIKSYNKSDIKEMLLDTSFDDKINLLKQECGVDYNSYPLAFRRGVACYRTPQIVQYQGQQSLKNKWFLDMDIPIFTKEHKFLGQIFKSGSDIFRNE